MRKQIYDLLRTSYTPLPSVLFRYYKKLDLNLEEVMLLIQYVITQQDMTQVSENMQLSVQEITLLINRLLEKQHLMMETTTTPEGKIDVVYSLEPLYQKLVTLIVQDETPQTINPQDMISVFEQEFGRALSSMELEMISGWVKEDGFSESLILLALKEAVVSQALSLKYIDRILLNWKQKNITTVEQVKQESQKHRQQKVSGSSLSADEETVRVLLGNYTK